MSLACTTNAIKLTVGDNLVNQLVITQHGTHSAHENKTFLRGKFRRNTKLSG